MNIIHHKRYIMSLRRCFAFFSAFLFCLLLITEAQSAAKKSSSGNKYRIPSRAIVVSPYGGYIFAKDLYVDTVEDGSGFGGGLNIRTQIYRNFGYVIDAFVSNLDLVETENAVLEEEMGPKFVAIYTGGFYYAIPDWKFNLCYGAISAGTNIMTIFVPGVEYYKFVSSRVSLFAKLSYLITNDWFSDMEYEEHFTSFMLSGGLSVVF